MLSLPLNLKKKERKRAKQTCQLVCVLPGSLQLISGLPLPICDPQSNRDVFKNSFGSNKTGVYDSLADFVLSTDLFVQENRFLRLAYAAGLSVPLFLLLCSSDDTT